MTKRLNGFDLTREIKSSPITNHLPVILITSLSDEDSRLEGIKAGADAFFVKPFDPKLLVYTINSLIKTRKILQSKFSKTTIGVDFDQKLGRDDRKFLEKAIKIVEDNISNFEFDVESFCKAINYSQPQTYRRIKSITNLSISEFIRTIRLKRAYDLLRKGDLSIKEIAYSVGFNDPNYFTKSYVRLFGARPSQHMNK